MRQECGTISKIDGARALVESSPESFCSSCEAKGSCVVAQDGRSKKIWLHCPEGQPGDQVVYEVNEKGVVLSSFILYMVPVAGLAIGAWAGNHYMGSEPAAAIGGVAGLMASGPFIALFTRLTARWKLLHPRIVEVRKLK